MADGTEAVATPTVLTAPTEVVFARLRQMTAAGAEGFEGLVADTLSEVSGQAFRLMKPGPQGGADGISDPVGNGLVVAMEAKRFQKDTRLPLDELKAKIADTAQAYPAAELWVLAASRDVAANDVIELERYAEPFGLAVLVLDARPHPGGLPLLAVLCAAAPRAMAEHFPADAELATSLDAARSAPGYEDAAWLRGRLRSPDVGYAAARTALARWMRTAMADLGTAKADLGSHADLLTTAGQARVPRKAADAFLTSVIADPGRLRALLGGEGIGKTWATLAWWHAHAGEAGDALPLTVWLPAKQVGQGDIEASIADALCKRTAMRDRAFWERRLRRWQAANGLRLLLVIDGLNQNWSFEGWTELLQPLLAGGWKGKVAVVVTCRPDHWAWLQELCDLVPQPHTRVLPPLDDPELDALLALHGRTRDDYDPRLLKLMRVPRLFALAVARERDLSAMADLTPEALALEDWRDRLRLHGNRIRLSYDEFRTLVSRLGTRFRDAFAAKGSQDLTRAELLDELGREGGYGQHQLAGAVSELVDGRWLSRVGPTRVHLDKDTTPIALGLSLLDVLRSKTKPSEIADAIADFTDPLRGADLGVAALRAATTAALLDSEIEPATRRALLVHWLTSQNFFGADFQAFWRLIGLAPGLFLDVARELWASGQVARGVIQDEVLTKAFAAASKWDDVAQTVDEAVSCWMSAVWPEGVEGARGSTEFPHVAVAALERLHVEVKHLQSALDPGPPALATLHPEPEGVAWKRLCAAAIAMSSYRPRAKAEQAYAAWALACAVAGGRPHAELVAWTLRINEEDPIEAERAVLQTVSILASSGSEPARVAAAILLRALATPACTELATQHDLPLRASLESPGWAEEPPGLPDVLSTHDLTRLGAEAISPRSEIGAQQLSSLVHLCRTQPVEALMDRLTGGPFRGLGAALARWAPAELSHLLLRAAQVASSATERPAWLEPLLLRMPDLLAFTDAGTRSALVAAWHAAAGDASPPGKPRAADAMCTVLSLHGAPADEQIHLLAAAEPAGVSDDLRFVLKPMPSDVVESMSDHMGAAAPVEHLKFWLQHLAWAGIEGGPSARTFLLDLAEHPDHAVRALAMSAMSSAGPGEAAVEFARRGWTWREGTARDEAIHGSYLLLHAKPFLGSAVLDRADPQIAGYALRHDEAEMDRFEALLEREIAHTLDHSVPKSSARRWCLVEKELDRFVEQRPGAAERLVAPFLGPHPVRSSALFTGFPVVGLCRGLLRHRPEAGARLWRSLMDEQREGNTTRRDFALLPFEAPRGEVMDALCEAALSEARDDDMLAAVAEAATWTEGDTWLAEVIARDLSATGVSAFVPARALTLAGFAHATPAMRHLWACALARPPAHGWLAEVHAQARTAFKQHEDALHWLERLASAQDRDTVAATHLLFTACADRRAARLARDRLNALKDGMADERAVTWNLVQAADRDRVKGQAREWARLYCATPIPTTNSLSPWR